MLKRQQTFLESSFLTVTSCCPVNFTISLYTSYKKDYISIKGHIKPLHPSVASRGLQLY